MTGPASPSAPGDPTAPPDPRRPGDVRWQQVVGGWFLGLAAVVLPMLVAGVAALLVDAFDGALSGETVAIPIALGGPVVCYGVALVWALRARRKGLAIGIALFGATVVLLSAACFVLVFANLPY